MKTDFAPPVSIGKRFSIWIPLCFGILEATADRNNPEKGDLSRPD